VGFFCIVNMWTNDVSHHLSETSHLLISNPLNVIQLILFDVFPIICTSGLSQSARSGPYYKGNPEKSEEQKFVPEFL